MNNERVYEQLKLLKEKESPAEGFEVEDIEGTTHKLGVSKDKCPKFFICTSDAVATIPNQTLETLIIEYNTACTFIDDSGEKKFHYSIITLLSSDDSLQKEFIDIMMMIISKLNDTPSKSEIAAEMEYLIAIFEAMHAAPKKKVQGLWAEMLVIDQSKNPDQLIKAWHSEPSSKYDFTMGRDKIEVKSTSSEERKHTFLLDQLNPTQNSRLLIASVTVRESGHGDDGLSIDELRDKICQRVESAEAQAHLFLVVAKTLGKDYRKARDLYFDYVEAADSLEFYDYHNIPKVAKEAVPKGVSGVKFVSDLTDIPDVKAEPIDISDSSLFKAII